MRSGIESEDSIIALVKETADGIGHLIADHVKLARLELVADVKTQGRRVAAIALVIPFIFLGYSLVWVGVAFALARWLGGAGAFFAVGGLHLVGGGIGVGLAVAKLKKGHLMRETSTEVSRSLATLSAPAAVTNGSSAAGHIPVRASSPSPSPSAAAAFGAERK
jgi:hypothetical protein